MSQFGAKCLDMWLWQSGCRTGISVQGPVRYSMRDIFCTVSLQRAHFSDTTGEARIIKVIVRVSTNKETPNMIFSFFDIVSPYSVV
jgi:hypothetical protein